MKEDFKKKAMQLEDIRLKRELQLVMQDFVAAMFTITVLLMFCYVILTSA